MYFLFLVSVLCGFHNFSEIYNKTTISSLNVKNLINPVEDEVYELLNIKISIMFYSVQNLSHIEKLNIILMPFLDMYDSIKSENDDLYKFVNNDRIIISFSNDKENHIRLQFYYIRNDLLSESLRRLIRIKGLSLRRNHFRELPEFFTDFTLLYRLDLSSNRFNKLPKVLFSLKNLTHLYLNDNEFQSIEDDIGRLEQLQVLDLSRNYIKSVSKTLKTLTKLVYLNLSFNVNIIRTRLYDMDITKDEEFLSKLPISIKCLYLEQILLRYIMSHFMFPDLYILNLRNNLLEDLSLCFIKCFNIWVVDASSNYLIRMPHNDRFNQLRKLNLQDNKIMEFFYLTKLMVQALKELDLRDCNIEQFKVEGYDIMDSSNGEYIKYENPNINGSRIPNDGSNKNNYKSSIICPLKTFSITIKNRFVVPNLLIFPKLIYLEITNKDYRDNDPDAARSRFDDLSKMKDLTILKLVGFNFITIPSVIFCLKKLQSLKLNSCKIKKIPVEITGLSNLINFDLYDNYIENINPKIFEFRESIYVRLTKNPFTYLPSEINNDNLKFNLAIDGPKVVLFKKDKNNLGVLDISYRKIYRINLYNLLDNISVPIKKLYVEAHKEEEYKWKLNKMLEIKQRTIKESINDYNEIVDYWNVLEKYITNNDMKEKFSNYIKILYGIKKRREEETATRMKNHIKNYLEAVFEILTNLVNTGNTNIVETIINKIEPSLSRYINDQLVHFSCAYYFLFSSFDESNVIEDFIENKIATLKYHTLWEITINDVEGVDLFLHWQNELSDTLGLPLVPQQDYLNTYNSFLTCKEYIIYQFFKLITVKSVVKYLYKSINKNTERIMMAYKYIYDNNDVENLKEYIEYGENLKIISISEKGIYFILKKWIL